MKAQRVLYLEPSGLVTGGAIALLRLVEAMDRRRFRPLVVLGSDGPLVARFREMPSCRVIVHPFPGGLSHVTRFNVLSGAILHMAGWLRYGLWLHSLARRWQADVVHTNGLKMHLLSVFVGRRPVTLLVWHLRDLVAPPYMPRRTALLVRWLANRIPDEVLCNSETTRKTVAGSTRAVVVASGIDASRRKVSTVPDGLAFDRPGDPPSIVKSEARGLRVVMLGRIAKWKGQDVFVRAALRLCQSDPSTVFLVAGHATNKADAAFERDLRRLVDCSGQSDRIRFLGLVNDVPGLLESVDVLAHCSTSPEPFGQVVIEAMAASVPVVATDLGGPAEIVTDGVDGLLVPPDDDEALARALGGLLQNDSVRERLAANGLDTVRTRFNIRQTALKVATIYENRSAELASRRPA